MDKSAWNRGCLSLSILVLVASWGGFVAGEISGLEDGKQNDLLLKRLDDIDGKLHTLDLKIASCHCWRGANSKHSGQARKGLLVKRDASADSFAPRDLLHFNKVADNSNSIPSSSSFHTELPDGQAAGSRDAVAPDKRLVMAVGQHYESLFGNALGDLESMLKEQMGSFKLTLNKLMNRLADHNYQHNVLTNHMELVKDECSLASNYADVAANLSHSLMAELGNSAGRAQKRSEVALVDQNTMRSSDLMMIVRLLGLELDQLIQKSLAARSEQMRPAQADRRQEWCGSRQPESDDPGRQLQAESSIERQLKSLQGRLDQIDSVTKHSAHMLAKMTQNSWTNQPLGLERYSQTHESGSAGSEWTKGTILSYSNGNETTTTTTTPPPPPPNSQLANKSRWFAGSKRPNQPVVPAASEQSSPAAPARQAKCQAKTNLVRPTSCRHLRDAGANCTGQYYVFVRGAIKHVYCDMNMESADEGGGWTVVLRRIDKSLGGPPGSEPQEARLTAGANSALRWLEAIKASQLDFRQDWSNYRNGFGYLDSWSEFFIGLDLLQQLASADSQGHQLQLDLVTNSSHKLHLRFDRFSLENESQQYRLHVAACNASLTALCRPILSLNASKFWTQDKLIEGFCSGGAGASQNSSSLAGQRLALPGWWLPTERLLSSSANGTREDCARDITQSFATIASNVLTGLVGRQQQGANEPPAAINHLHWPDWEHSHEPIRQLVLKVRPHRSHQSER